MLPVEDHRAIARELGLLHFQDDAPGMVFWHPRGLALYRVLEEAQRRQIRREGYREVRSPQLVRRAMWESSGHWQHFREGMIEARQGDHEAALKPVSCPAHIAIVSEMAPSYRELPVRLAELGIVHRDEASGALHGLLRLRQFSQDDGHVFCSEAQADAEIARFMAGVRPFYAQFGFREIELALSLRPADRAGDDAVWDRAEASLAAALDRAGERYVVQPGGGAFYGPKVEIALRDRAGRAWQCGTIQLDLVMPSRFGLRYVAASGERLPFVMLHRALYGSLERFMGMLLEHHGARLPMWLAPEQVAVLPVSAREQEHAARVRDALADEGLRVCLEGGDASLSKRVAGAHERAIPWAVIIGPREVERGEVSLRSRDIRKVVSLDEARALLREEARPGA